MRIITPSVEIMSTGIGKDVDIRPEQFIEKVGRTCYKSEDKITDDSAAKFVGNLIKRGHEAMIEHWSLIFKTEAGPFNEFKSDWNLLLQGSNITLSERLRPHLRFTDYYMEDGSVRYVISGNMRALRDYAKACVEGFGFMPMYMWGTIRNYPLFFPEYQDYVPPVINNNILMPIPVCDLSEFERQIHQNVTMKFVCDRGVSHEMVRHRVASFAQESTRYCNYSLDKFGKEITVVRPSWCGQDSDLYKRWYEGCKLAESAYFALVDEGATPQEARSVLPNSTKTEIIVTMNLDGWDHFFGLRDNAAAHPDMREIAAMAHCMYDKKVKV